MTQPTDNLNSLPTPALSSQQETPPPETEMYRQLGVMLMTIYQAIHDLSTSAMNQGQIQANISKTMAAVAQANEDAIDAAYAKQKEEQAKWDSESWFEKMSSDTGADWWGDLFAGIGTWTLSAVQTASTYLDDSLTAVAFFFSGEKLTGDNFNKFKNNPDVKLGIKVFEQIVMVEFCSGASGLLGIISAAGFCLDDMADDTFHVGLKEQLDKLPPGVRLGVTIGASAALLLTAAGLLRISRVLARMFPELLSDVAKTAAEAAAASATAAAGAVRSAADAAASAGMASETLETAATEAERACEQAKKKLADFNTIEKLNDRMAYIVTITTTLQASPFFENLFLTCADAAKDDEQTKSYLSMVAKMLDSVTQMVFMYYGIKGVGELNELDALKTPILLKPLVAAFKAAGKRFGFSEANALARFLKVMNIIYAINTTSEAGATGKEADIDVTRSKTTKITSQSEGSLAIVDTINTILGKGMELVQESQKSTQSAQSANAQNANQWAGMLQAEGKAQWKAL